MTNIYVGNLNFSTSESDLRAHFAQHGQVGDVKIITDRETGRPRGFAFVDMPDGSEAQNAMDNLDGQDFDGRTLKVNQAKARDRS